VTFQGRRSGRHCAGITATAPLEAGVAAGALRRPPRGMTPRGREDGAGRRGALLPSGPEASVAGGVTLVRREPGARVFRPGIPGIQAGLRSPHPSRQPRRGMQSGAGRVATVADPPSTARPGPIPGGSGPRGRGASGRGGSPRRRPRAPGRAGEPEWSPGREGLPRPPTTPAPAVLPPRPTAGSGRADPGGTSPDCTPQPRGAVLNPRPAGRGQE
jgi:hypothetical protein